MCTSLNNLLVSFNGPLSNYRKLNSKSLSNLKFCFCLVFYVKCSHNILFFISSKLETTLMATNRELVKWIMLQWNTLHPLRRRIFICICWYDCKTFWIILSWVSKYILWCISLCMLHYKIYLNSKRQRWLSLGGGMGEILLPVLYFFFLNIWYVLALKKKSNLNRLLCWFVSIFYMSSISTLIL